MVDKEAQRCLQPAQVVMRHGRCLTCTPRIPREAALRAAPPTRAQQVCARAHRASAKLIGLTLCASRGACVLHRSGRLAVELCSLELNTAGGLDHLFAAIVTTAAGALEAPLGLLQLRPARPAAGVAAKPSCGVLTVTETRIQVSLAYHRCPFGSTLLAVNYWHAVLSHLAHHVRVYSAALHSSGYDCGL